jgi:hypothetical protein
MIEIGSLVTCKDYDFGLGVVVSERPFGGFIVFFPNSDLRCESKCLGLSTTNLEVIA